MQIQSITLENIRSYSKETIQFPKGSIVLSGDIGAGKSTLLLALEFAFFGMRGKSVSGLSLLRNGTRSGAIHVTFAIGKETYTITRKLKRTNTSVSQDTGTFVHNGITTHATAIELKSKILGLFQYPTSLLTKSKNLIYTYTVYTPQEEMKHILLDSPDARLEVLRKVFGFDKYKTIRENAAMFQKHLREQIIHLDALLQEPLDQQCKDISQKKKDSEQQKQNLRPLVEQKKIQLQHITEKRSRIQEQVQKKMAVENDLKIAMVRYQEKEQLLQRFTIETEGCKNELLELQRKNQELVEVKISEISIPDIERYMELKNQEYQILSQQIKELADQVFMIEKKKSELNNTINALNNIPQSLQLKKQNVHQLKLLVSQKPIITQQLQSLQLTLDAASSQLREIEVHISTAKNTSDAILNLYHCPLCQQEVGIQHKQVIRQRETKIIEEKSVQLEENTQKVTYHQQQKHQLQDQLRQIQEKELQLRTLQMEILNLELQEKQLIEHAATMNSIDYQLNLATQKKNETIEPDKILQEIEEMRIILQELRAYEIKRKEKQFTQDKINECSNKLVALQKLMRSAQNDIALLKNAESSLRLQLQSYANLTTLTEQIEMEYRTIEKDYRELEITLATKVKECSMFSEQLVHLENRLVIQTGQRKQRDIIRNHRSWIEKKFIPLMATIEKHLLVQVYQRFNELFQHWFGVLMEDDTIGVRLNTSFTPIIIQNGYETDYTYLSGGEKTSCALAYRLALNKVVNDVQSNLQTKDLLILDEPTDGFSSEQLDKLRIVLDQLQMTQIIIVSHEEKIESFVDHVIRIHKDEHLSRVV